MDPYEQFFSDVLERVRPHDRGAPADYIPELARVDPERLALAGVGPRGIVRAAGDADDELTIQSISKPFVLALVLQAIGRDALLERVGAEPSGEPFNAISLEPGSGRPANPLVNAGAIATTALIEGSSVDDRMAVITEGLSAFAGRLLHVDEEVYASESASGDRNRALAHLLRSYGVLSGDVETASETYFRQCSLVVTTSDLAVMAATLAFGGVNPVTGREVVDERVARDVTSIMASCGMYDSSGDWLLKVGLPAKSSVSGGVIALSPSQFGLAAFSPRLDGHGNSVRGSLLVQRMSESAGLHVFEPHESVAAPELRVEDDGDGPTLRVSGELSFAGAERVSGLLRDVVKAHRGAGMISVDTRGSGRIHPGARHALGAEVDRIREGLDDDSEIELLE